MIRDLESCGRSKARRHRWTSAAKDSQNYDVIVHVVETFSARLILRFDFLRAVNKLAIRNY